METPPPSGGHVVSGLSAPPSLLTAQNLRVATQSPSSDALSHSHADLAKSANGTSANGEKQGPKKTAFDLYADERRPELLEKALASEPDDQDDLDPLIRKRQVAKELEREWEDLSEDARGRYQDLADKQRDGSSVKKEDAPPRSGGDRSSSSAKPTTAPHAAAEDNTPTATQDEDVEMGNYDSDQETQGEKQDE